MTPSFVDRALPSTSLMLTVKLDGAPGVHLVYDCARPFEQTAVTVLDQSYSGSAWRFEDVVWQALIFLLSYWVERSPLPSPRPASSSSSLLAPPAAHPPPYPPARPLRPLLSPPLVRLLQRAAQGTFLLRASPLRLKTPHSSCITGDCRLAGLLRCAPTYWARTMSASSTTSSKVHAHDPGCR